MRLVPVTDGSAAAQQLRRSAMDIANSAVLQARSILDDVRSHGDAAVRNYTTKFDGVSLTSLRVSESEISDAYNQVPASQVKAIKLMKDRLARSERVLLEPLKHISVNYSGVSIARKIKPIESVGCYVPGGKARYPSTLVMCAVPARIAGVKRIVAISPPRKDGSIDPLTLVAADICGVNEIYKIGGAQGISALAFGTETIKPVSKIVGPGGMIVTAAKIAASSHTSTDMVAGPTELLIFADESSDPKLVALDLISQAEHSQDTLVGFVTASERVAEAVLSEVNSITNSSELARSEYVRKSLEQNGFAAVCKDLSSAIRFINEFAPEHLEIISRKASSIASRIESAGLVLLGANSPSAASDYCLGSNHVLPTLGFAKSRGSLSALDFVKVINFVQVSQTAIASIEQSIKALTDAEGFPNHYNAVKARMDNGRAKKKKDSKKRQ